DIPSEDAIVFRKRSDDSLHISLEAWDLSRIGKGLVTRALHPSGIVNARGRIVLLAQARSRVPAGVEEHQQRPDMVLGSDGQKLIEALLESGCVLLPKQIVQEHAHGVHAQGFSPAEFLIDLRRIEAVGLPHLELIDGRFRNVVTAHEPGLLRVPVIGLLFGPAGGLSKGNSGTEKSSKKDGDESLFS